MHYVTVTQPLDKKLMHGNIVRCISTQVHFHKTKRYKFYVYIFQIAESSQVQYIRQRKNLAHYRLFTKPDHIPILSLKYILKF